VRNSACPVAAAAANAPGRGAWEDNLPGLSLSKGGFLPTNPSFQLAGRSDAASFDRAYYPIAN
jgi:hypothetical protein